VFVANPVTVTMDQYWLYAQVVNNFMPGDNINFKFQEARKLVPLIEEVSDNDRVVEELIKGKNKHKNKVFIDNQTGKYITTYNLTDDESPIQFETHHNEHQTVHALDGVIEITVRLEPGQSLTIPAGTNHRVGSMQGPARAWSSYEDV
jgi:mannose-6-phosphate isomerase-like protein (cupin superfamily)